MKANEHIHPTNAAKYTFGVHCQWMLDATMRKKTEACKVFQIMALPEMFFSIPVDSAVMYVQYFSQFSSGHFRFFDKLDILIKKFVMRHPAFQFGIRHIIHLGSYKKMFWVHTRSVIASMAYQKRANRQRSSMEQIRASVGELQSFFNPKNSVAILIHRPMPLPASIFADFVFVLKANLHILSRYAMLFQTPMTKLLGVMIPAQFPSYGTLSADFTWVEESSSHGASPIRRFAPYNIERIK